MQGVVKKEIHSVGKPFSLILSDLDEIEKIGFSHASGLHPQPASFSLLPGNKYLD
jgi:hypothetical protein